jgi:hypothetical protein
MSISANTSDRESVMVPLARIPTDEGAQTRVRVRAAVFRDYAAAMKQQLDEGTRAFRRSFFSLTARITGWAMVFIAFSPPLGPDLWR